MTSATPLPLDVPPRPAPVIVGVDVGALSSRVVLGSSHDHELVRDGHGGHAAPTAVSFPGKNHARLLGEDAPDPTRSDGNTVGMLDRLLPGALEDGIDLGGDALAAFWRFRLVAPHDEKDANGVVESRVYVPSMEEEYPATALMAMLLGSVRRNVIATLNRLGGEKTDGQTAENLHFVFAVPPGHPQSARDALVDAAFAASIPSSSVVDSAHCVAAVYNKKFGDAQEENDKKAVLVVEMGHARSCVSVVVKKRVTGNQQDGEDDGNGATAIAEDVSAKKQVSNEKHKYEMEVLSTMSSSTFGAGLVDIALYRHFLSSHPSLTHLAPETFEPNSRPAQRLLEGCRKLKHLLSMLPENKVTVENIGKNDSDVNLSCTRELLKKLCHESVVDRLKGMIETAIGKAGGMEALGEIGAVEIAGGGSRIPMVQEAILGAIGKGEEFALSRSLDDTALAFGASLIGINPSADAEMMDVDREARRARLLEMEMALAQRDAKLLRKDDFRNRIEAHILELRSAKHSKHGSLLPSSEDFTSHLDGVDDWLFSEECDVATVEQVEEKWNAVQSRTQELCSEYLAAKQAEAKQKELEMEKEAQRAAAERAMNGEDEDEDHDTRRLPTKRRMEIVMKNKNEANELFSDGNYRHAAARYAKALTHCSKFFDLGPEEEAEVREVKLSLHLNMALAYIKLEKMDNAHRSCDDALLIDAANTKALYRRATVLYKKRKFDDAVRDLKEAERLVPGDGAVKKLRRLVEQQFAKQKKKEKAMAKKMFG